VARAIKNTDKGPAKVVGDTVVTQESGGALPGGEEIDTTPT